MDQITTVKIILPTMEDAKSFVAVVARYPMEMDLRIGRYVVDAKSILGILSLGKQDILYLDVYGAVPERFLEDISAFIVTEGN